MFLNKNGLFSNIKLYNLDGLKVNIHTSVIIGLNYI
jgi:hypothetical protein